MGWDTARRVGVVQTLLPSPKENSGFDIRPFLPLPSLLLRDKAQLLFPEAKKPPNKAA